MLAVNGVIVTNTGAKANAYLDNETVTETDDVTVEAKKTSLIDATVHRAKTSGAQAAGVTLAFNTVGWAPGNVLFHSLNALVGTNLGTEMPAEGRRTSRTRR